MAEFTADFQFPALSPGLFDSSTSFQGFFSVSNDLFGFQNSDGIFPENNQIAQPILSGGRKRISIDELETSSAILTPQASENGIKRKRSSGGGRRGRGKACKREEEKSGEIVLVRARRGQATDSHSLAERVRRGKINERLRCLQDIVPGCYKSMGMAGMLDEIINYVQSLQNQVEFLSMKLGAATTFNEFNSDKIALKNLQKREAEEAKELERSIREGCGTLACFQPAWPF